MEPLGGLTITTKLFGIHQFGCPHVKFFLFDRIDARQNKFIGPLEKPIHIPIPDGIPELFSHKDHHALQFLLKKKDAWMAIDGRMQAMTDQLQALMEETKDKVEIVYMGSNQDAILNGQHYGARQGANLLYTDDSLGEAMRATSGAVGRVLSGRTRTVEYTDLERNFSAGTTTFFSSVVD